MSNESYSNLCDSITGASNGHGGRCDLPAPQLWNVKLVKADGNSFLANKMSQVSIDSSSLIRRDLPSIFLSSLLISQ